MKKEMILQGLEPDKVFYYFEEICEIPHGSGNTERISEYLVRFAEEQKLSYTKEPCGNVIIRKDATPGYETEPGIILQGHMDMVAVQEPDCKKDMKTEGLSIFTDGKLVGAYGTSLGGDDGIALAYALAILSDRTIPHPALEFVATIDEETGMDGAMALNPENLSGTRLINLDSEEEGTFIVGCAGGETLRLNLSFEREPIPSSEQVYEIIVSGLQGGHSGTEIDKNRSNGILILGRVLRTLAETTSYRLISIEGGTKDNAIPVSAKTVISASEKPHVEQIEAELRNALTGKEEGFRLDLEALDDASSDTIREYGAMDAHSKENLICLLNIIPYGVATMSTLPGLVETSNNVGIIRTKENEVELAVSVRSLIVSEKTVLSGKIQTIATLCGCSVTIHGGYPGWQYREKSSLRMKAVAAFALEYGREPLVQTIHAGLECGLLIEKMPELDAISMGPNIYDIHTTKERLDIASVQRTWKLLLRILATKD